MARVALPYSVLTVNGSLADPAGVAAVAGAGNGVSIPDVSPNRRQSRPELTLLRVVNGAAAGNVTVLAGSEPLAIAAGQGDLVVAVGANATEWVGPLESGRFIQPTGELIVETDQAMTITAFEVSRH
jgi:hypothetical protein